MEHAETKARFFIEEHPENLGGEPRHQVLARVLNPETCQFLEDHGWGVALAMIEPDEPTARLIKDINQRFPELPVSAWIVVDDKDGYWITKFNVPQTRQKIEEIKAWANNFDLDFEAIGLDLEPPIDVIRGFMTRGLIGLIKARNETNKKYRWQQQSGYSPEEEIKDILNQLKKESITTHSYEMPFPLNIPSLGVLQVEDFDTRVTMVYSTQGLPRFIESRIPTVCLKQGTYPAIGVYSSTGLVPGRSLGLFDESPINRDILEQDINTLSRKAQYRNSDFPQNLWVFALTDVQVARWTEEALEQVKQLKP